VLLFGWSLRPAFLPGPLEVLSAYPRLFDQGLAQQLFVSLSTNFQALGLTCLLTLPLAYLTVLPALRPFVRSLSKARFLGLTGFVVLFTILFGGGHGLKVALLVFGMGVFQVTSLYDVVEAIPREEFDHARTLRMGAWGSVIEVVILGHLDAVLDAIRQNAAMGWVMLTLVEGLVRFEGGLGAMMLAEDKHIQLDAVFAIQALVLIIGIGQDWAIVALKRLLCPYASLTLERTN
jgi:NitT/TauT family transport system permease protein